MIDRGDDGPNTGVFQSTQEGKHNVTTQRRFPGRVKSSRKVGQSPKICKEDGDGVGLSGGCQNQEEMSLLLESEGGDLGARTVVASERQEDELAGLLGRVSDDNDMDNNSNHARMESVSYTSQFLEQKKGQQKGGGVSRAREQQPRQHVPPGHDNNQEQQEVVVSVSMYRSTSAPRMEKFLKILEEPIVNLDGLRELAWSGIPPSLRPLCWRLLLGYVPPNRELRDQVLLRKRREYKNLVVDYYNTIVSSNGNNNNNNMHTMNDEECALRQVAVDVPRTAPDVPFFHQDRIQKSLERILFIWGIRHPASGYVQGINDLATPFLAIFTSERMDDNTPMDSWQVDSLSYDDVLDIEADSYWCLCKLLDGIQDHYTYAQPGIQKTLFRVGELVGRVERQVSEHFDAEGVQYMQFAFRWVNCLLLRELPFHLGIRLWDTYVSEGSTLKEFLGYVLSSFLLSWAPELKKMDFQEIIMFLQRCPTSEWTEREIELVLSRAFMWRVSFKDASSHFQH